MAWNYIFFTKNRGQLKTIGHESKPGEWIHALCFSEGKLLVRRDA